MMSEVQCESFGLTKEQYWECRQDFIPKFYIDKVESEEPYDEEYIEVLYLDGDDGVALISHYCECFSDEGFKIELIDCKYCDIQYSDMIEILEIFKGFEEAYKERDKEREMRGLYD